jgi:signal transduction histidine kinase
VIPLLIGIVVEIQIRTLTLARSCQSVAQWTGSPITAWRRPNRCPTAPGKLRKNRAKGKEKQMCAHESGEEKPGPVDQRMAALIAEHEIRLKEIADLVAHVRHEINNPLTGVLGQAQLLLREDLSPSARRRIETIEQLAGRIRDVVARLREIQRPPNSEAGG